MKLRNYLLLGLITVILSNCDIHLTKDTNNAKLIGSLPIVKNYFDIKEIWHTQVGNGVNIPYSHLHMAIKDSTIYASDRYNIVQALNLESGKKEWQLDLLKRDKDQNNLFNKYYSYLFDNKNESLSLDGGIIVDNDNIYITSELGIVYAINRYNGVVIWKTKVLGEVTSSPIINNDLVIIHTNNGMVQALDKKSGIIKWTINISNNIKLENFRNESIPAITSNKVIVGGNYSVINVINSRDGQLLWKKYISGFIDEDVLKLNDVYNKLIVKVLVIKNTIYASLYNGSFVALDLNSGNILWKYNIKNGIKNFIINKNKIYIIEHNDNIISLNIKNGSKIWDNNQLMNRNITTLVVYDNKHLIIGDQEGYLHIINNINGNFIFQKKIINDSFPINLLKVNKKIFIQSNKGIVYSFLKID